MIVDGEQFVGFIDFSEMQKDYFVIDYSICLAYLMINTSDPINIATQFLRAYNKEKLISQKEFKFIFPLIKIRILTSIILNSSQLEFSPLSSQFDVSLLDQYGSQLILFLDQYGDQNFVEHLEKLFSFK